MKGRAMITQEQAEQAVRERWRYVPVPELRNLVLEPINTGDIGSSLKDDDFGPFELEQAGWKCTFEARYPGPYGEWYKDTSYIVEAKPGPYVIE